MTSGNSRVELLLPARATDFTCCRGATPPVRAEFKEVRSAELCATVTGARREGSTSACLDDEWINPTTTPAVTTVLAKPQTRKEKLRRCGTGSPLRATRM